jgi:1-acyl-sn-glycerol-3-phosphate acyltransferase
MIINILTAKILKRQRDLELEKQKELELELEKQRELELQKQKELELQKQKELELQKQRELELQKQMELELEKQMELEVEKIDQRSLLNNVGNNDVMKYLNTNTIFSNDITKPIINALYTELIKNSFNNNSYKQLYKTIEAKNNTSYENFNNKNINEKGKLIIANHLDVADTIVILNKINTNTFIITTNVLFDIIFQMLNVTDTIISSTILKLLNIIIYDNTNKNGKTVKEQMLKTIMQGNNILLYPEGQFGYSQSNIEPFYPGGIKIAYDNKIPIMPIVLYYSNINHLYQHHQPKTLEEKIFCNLLIYKYSGNIIVHHCNDGKDILPLVNETFEEFKERLHNMMQTELRELNKKHNPNFKPL